MLHPRVIPCLLVHNNGLVKTRKFREPKYVGDPINAVKIFNEKEVDELVVLDIDASSRGAEPDFGRIENLAVECRMPLCYGGGVKTEDQALRICGLGVEKVAISSAAVQDPELVSRLARRIGSQSMVVILDVKKRRFGGKYEIWIHNAGTNVKRDPVDFAREMEDRGVGEIVINSIDNDGMMNGYDLELIDSVANAISVPMTALGGAGSLEDIGTLIAHHGIIGAAAGSVFVFKGVYRAVLINYPNSAEKSDLIAGGIHRFNETRSGI